MRILVTGGAGYIGAITARYLLEQAHEVVVLDTLERGPAAAVPDGALLIQGDVGSPEMTRLAVMGCDAVIHCAGYIEVAESVAEPQRYLDNNVERPRVLLEAMGELGVRALVFSSSAAVYGVSEEIPIPEAAAPHPVSPYGESKLAFERILVDEAGTGRIASVSLRYFNAAGAWPDGSLGEAHDPESHLIPRILRGVAAGEPRITLFGDDYPTPDGTCVRDYVHVLDLAWAHLLAAEWLVEGLAQGETPVATALNLGTGTGFSNREVVAACAAVTGVDIEIERGPRRPGDPAVLVASNARAAEVLGWEPERGELATIVTDAWLWEAGRASSDVR